MQDPFFDRSPWFRSVRQSVYGGWMPHSKVSLSLGSIDGSHKLMFWHGKLVLFGGLLIAPGPAPEGRSALGLSEGVGSCGPGGNGQTGGV